MRFPLSKDMIMAQFLLKPQQKKKLESLINTAYEETSKVLIEHLQLLDGCDAERADSHVALIMSEKFRPVMNFIFGYYHDNGYKVEFAEVDKFLGQTFQCGEEASSELRRSYYDNFIAENNRKKAADDFINRIMEKPDLDILFFYPTAEG